MLKNQKNDVKNDVVHIKGNLAHKFIDVCFLCLSFHLDMSNSKVTEKNGNTD